MSLNEEVILCGTTVVILSPLNFGARLMYVLFHGIKQKIYDVELSSFYKHESNRTLQC